ncbi:MAG: NPCBM/NEW2 domain-containing protein [Planctomycetota bacterium]
MRIVALTTIVLCAAPAAQGAPNARIDTIDGRHLSGALLIDGNGHATVTGEATVELGLDEIAAVEFAATQQANLPERPHRVWLRSGAEFEAVALRGLPAGDGKPARLGVELALGCTLDLPFGAVRAFRMGGAGRAEPASFARDLDAPSDNTDLLYVQKDDKQYRFQVTITGMSATAIEFDLRGEARDFACDGLLGAVFGKNTGFAADRQPQPRVAVDFDSTDHLEGKLLGLGAELTLRLDEGAEVRVPITHVMRLGVASNRQRWLSDMTPEVEQTPAFDRIWPWLRNRTLAGPNLVLGGRSWSRGIFMVPRTRLTYDLDGKYDVFDAILGIDDRGGPQAHALFRVYVDGKVAFESQPCMRGMPPQAVHLELGRCKKLAIEADFGKNYDLGDYCVFADARVMQR